MSDAKQISVNELYQQSVLEAAKDFQEQLKGEEHIVDDEIAEMESKKEWMNQQMHEYKRLMEELEEGLKEHMDFLNKKCDQKLSIRRKRLMIEDLKAFAKGERFGKNVQGALFFANDLKSFCDVTGEGMVSVREQVGKKSWYGMLELKGKHYVYLKTKESELYFSEEVGSSFLGS